MKNVIKKLMPKGLKILSQKYKEKYRERRYFQQGLTKVKCGNYELDAPKEHLILKVTESQPYRDTCIGIVAKYISEKYPSHTIIDVGANIGDTAALIATYAKNKLILIEASDYYFDILKRNMEKIPNETIMEKIMLLDGGEIKGKLNHKIGTAVFKEDQKEDNKIKTQRLCNITREPVCFIKIDVDGHDRKILLDSIEWLQKNHPAVLFESYIRNPKDLSEANQISDKLFEAGYQYFTIWDDAGFHLLSTTSLNLLKDLNRYLFKVFQAKGRKSIYNYDILCMNQRDKDVYEQIYRWFSQY